MEVKKRGGDLEAFDPRTIFRSISKANRNKNVPADMKIDEDKITKVVDYVVKKVKQLNLDVVETKKIATIVEDGLMNRNCYDIAREYILHRKKQEDERLMQTELMLEVKEKLLAENVLNQNANMDEHSFGGRKGEASSEVMKKFALLMMNPRWARNHETNKIYQHDMDSYYLGMHNCLSLPLDDMLANDIDVRQTGIRPAGCISTAMQLVAVYFQIQSLQQFGGVAATHLDWTLLPYVVKSLRKHYFAEYCKDQDDFYDLDLVNIKQEKLEKWINSKIDQWKKDNPGITFDMFRIKNRDMFDKKLFQKALFETRREAYQSAEGLIHNLNSLQSRSGNQLPFSSINFGTCDELEGQLILGAICSAYIKGTGKFGLTPIFPCGIFQYKLKNGKVVNEKLFKDFVRATSTRLYPNYGNCQWSVHLKGIEYDRNLKKKALEDLKIINPSKYQRLLLWVETHPEDAKKINLGVPTIVVDDLNTKNIIVIDEVQPTEEFSTMGCRTYNGYDINFDEDYFNSLIDKILETDKLPINYLYSANQKDGRGNIAPATIILPTIAMEAKKKAERAGHPEYAVEEFMAALEKAIGECKDSLIDRYNWICAQSVDCAKFMWKNNTMKGYIPEEGIRSALKHGTLAIGQLGVAETIQILLGCNQMTPKGMKLAQDIEQLYKDKCNEYKNNYKLNFGVYYTPAENLCYTAMTKFTKKYGLIENVSAYKDKDGNLVKRDYFTNSIHVPVWEEIDPFEKIDIESQLTGYSSAGCITYVEIEDSAKYNLTSLEQIIKHAMDKDIPYFALNLRLCSCKVCGYSGDIGDACPKCGAIDLDENGNPTGNIERLARVTGYLSTDYRYFNKGKQGETDDRYKHTMKLITGWTRPEPTKEFVLQDI